MTLTLFWIKTTIKRTINLIKSSPFIIVWVVIVAGAFVYSITNNYIKITLEPHIITAIMFFLAFVSLIKSLKNHNTIPVLLRQSKSKLQNKNILTKFFIKQAFINNLLLILFCVITFNNLENKYQRAAVLTVIIVSIFLSFVIMRVRNHQKTGNRKSKTASMVKMHPLIKSVLYDYSTPDFIATAAVCFALFIFAVIEFTRNMNNFNELDNTYIFFIATAVIISIGFMGIIDSVSNINWKFHAIVSKNTFSYHIKRAAIFLAGIFGLLILLFIVFGVKISFTLALKYLFCIIILFWVSVFAAFTISNMLIKAIVLMSASAFTVWIGTLPAGFLPVLAVPLFAALLKAKNEYREWYLS